MNVDPDRERLDAYLVRVGLAASRRAARALIAEGRVRINGRKLGKGASVAAADRVAITQAPDLNGIQPNPDLEVPILYVDDALLVVNKPALMPCHPLRAVERNTVMNAIQERLASGAQD